MKSRLSDVESARAIGKAIKEKKRPLPPLKKKGPAKKTTKGKTEKPVVGKKPKVGDVNEALKNKNITSEEAFELNPRAGLKPGVRDVNAALRSGNITGAEAQGLNKKAGLKPKVNDLRSAVKEGHISMDEGVALYGKQFKP